MPTPAHFRKYPRTPHLPWSPGGTSDDAYLVETAHFEGREIVVTEKMDGENTSLYRDGFHARSLDSRHHPSRAWVKALHAQIAPSIPERWRLCGENLFARHSIPYKSLASYFLLFSVWNENDEALSWDETREWGHLLGLSLVPQIHRGLWDEGVLRSLPVDTERQEGYVVRRAEAFACSEFPEAVAKWVRSDHVQSDKHWMHGEVRRNKLAACGEEKGKR